MGDLDDVDSLFQNWLYETYGSQIDDPKIISLIKIAYESGHKQGNKEKQKSNYEEWNQK